MKIIFDCGFDSNGFPFGFAWIDTSDVSFQTTAAEIQADKTKMAASGWGAPSNLPGLPDGTRRWDVLVIAAGKANADPKLVALGLTK